MLQISVLLFIFLVVLSFLCVKYAYSFWRTRGFSQATPKFPYGNFEGAGQTVSVSQRLTSIYEEFKDKASVVGIYVFLSPSILVTDLEVVQHVLMKDFSNFHDRGFYYNIKDDPLSGILFAIEGQEWRQTRAKLTQSLTISKIKLMFNTIVNISEEMLEYLANQESPKELDLKELMNQLASDVIGNVALGLDTNCIKNSDNLFMKMGKKVFYLSPFRTIKMFVMSSYTNLARKLGMRFTDMDVEEFFLGSFRETLKYREENNIVRSDFMNTMIQFKKEAENDMHNEKSDDTLFNELAAQCYMIFVAGNFLL